MVKPPAVPMVLTNANACMPQAADETLEKAICAFQCPSLVSSVKEVLPVVRNSFAFLVDDDGRIVILGRRRPPIGNIDFLRVSDNDGAVVLESSRASP